jgi:hypothetical protein
MTETKHKVAIGMPLEGDAETSLCHYSVQRELRKLKGGDVLFLDEMGGIINPNVDVSRARDRLMRLYLWDSDCTHLLWWDSDVLPSSLQAIRNMLNSGYDCVGAPYRRKKEPEEYPYRLHGVDGQKRKLEVVNGCIEVEWMAFGFMLTSRACLQTMWDAYKDSRWYFDLEKKPEGKHVHHLTVGAFDLVYTDEEPGPDGTPWRVKLSEDYSFCKSYRDIGGKVHMYVGDGSPVGHIGSKLFTGTREGLVHSA